MSNTISRDYKIILIVFVDRGSTGVAKKNQDFAYSQHFGMRDLFQKLHSPLVSGILGENFTSKRFESRERYCSQQPRGMRSARCTRGLSRL